MIWGLKKSWKDSTQSFPIPLTKFLLFLIIRSILIYEFTQVISCDRKHLCQNLYFDMLKKFFELKQSEIGGWEGHKGEKPKGTKTKGENLGQTLVLMKTCHFPVYKTAPDKSESVGRVNWDMKGQMFAFAFRY